VVAKTDLVRGQWSAAERQNLVTLYAQGLPYHQIARELGRSLGSVHKQAQRLQIRGRHRWWTMREIALIRQHRSVLRLAQELGRSYASVASARYRAKRCAYVQEELWDTY
jgi:transposase-like protein